MLKTRINCLKNILANYKSFFLHEEPKIDAKQRGYTHRILLNVETRTYDKSVRKSKKILQEPKNVIGKKISFEEKDEVKKQS